MYSWKFWFLLAEILIEDHAYDQCSSTHNLKMNVFDNKLFAYYTQNLHPNPLWT